MTPPALLTIGQGRFRPNDSAHPAIGEAGQLEKVQEAKVEVIFPEHLEQKFFERCTRSIHMKKWAYDLFKIDEPTKTMGTWPYRRIIRRNASSTLL